MATLRLIPSRGSRGGETSAWVVFVSEALMRVQAGLTTRDLVLLGWLADHGVLTTDQVAVGLFPSVNFAQRRCAP
jgi:hypothetical protein